MTGTIDFAAHRAAQVALYAPTSASITKHLPDTADSLAAALVHLARDPTTDGAERLAARLNGVAATCMHLRLALIRESQAVPPNAA